MPLGGPASPCTGKSGWLGSVAPCEEAEAAASRYLLSAGTAQQATVQRLGWPPSVSLFPPSSKGSWGAVCVRARAENVAYIYSAAHHAAQHRCDAWGAVRAGTKVKARKSAFRASCTSLQDTKKSAPSAACTSG
jgi:hypothetical protein